LTLCSAAAKPLPSRYPGERLGRIRKIEMTTPPTASQTVGPFFHLGMVYLEREKFVAENVAGERVTIRGKVIDGDGNVVPDAVLEVWQADSSGRYQCEVFPRNSGTPRFLGFGRVETDDNGEFSFTTIKPGRVPSPDGLLQAPHLVVTLFSRGLLKALRTRLYFPDEASNAKDAVLNLVPPERRSTLVAAPSSEPSGTSVQGKVFHWNIVMQGRGETVFFEY
jgi:protocatechuate 3,4-dioxygenase alpha subunit